MFTRSAAFYDAIYSFKDYAAEAELVHAAIQSRSPGAASLLDVACGTGKHLEHLRGHYRAEGLDLDERLLAIARERCPQLAFHQGDMVDFDLGRTFDAVTCLFSAIGYATTTEALRSAIAAMARHLEPGGVLVVEPWLAPDVWLDRHVSAVFVDEPQLKLARISRNTREGDTSIVDFSYLVGTADEVEHFTEEHRLGLFTQDEYLDAFRAAGLDPEHDPQGPIGRGLYVGVRPYLSRSTG
jgi:SAM-dependent methyltransferase